MPLVKRQTEHNSHHHFPHLLPHRHHASSSQPSPTGSAKLSPPPTPVQRRSPTPDLHSVASATASSTTSTLTATTPRQRSTSFNDATPRANLKILPPPVPGPGAGSGSGTASPSKSPTTPNAATSFASSFSRPEFLKHGGSNPPNVANSGTADRPLSPGRPLRSHSSSNPIGAATGSTTPTTVIGAGALRPGSKPLVGGSSSAGSSLPNLTHSIPAISGHRPSIGSDALPSSASGGPSVSAGGHMSTFDARLVARAMDRATTGVGGGGGAGGTGTDHHVGAGGVGGAQSIVSAMGLRPGDAWSQVVLRVIPLFNGEGHKGFIEDINDLVSQHIRRLISESPSRAFQRLSQDIIELLSNGMITLHSKLSPDQLTDDRLAVRLIEVWHFFFTGVLPYLEGIFLPLLTDPQWLTVEQKTKNKPQPTVSSFNGVSTNGGSSSPSLNGTLGSQYTHSQQNGGPPTAEVEHPSIDVRRLSLMAFRDHLICPIFPRLSRLFTELYLDRSGASSRRPSRSDPRDFPHRRQAGEADDARSRSTSPGGDSFRLGSEEASRAHTPSPRDASPTPTPTQAQHRHRTRSFLSADNSHPPSLTHPVPPAVAHPGAPGTESHSSVMHAKRLQMVSVLSSVLTHDDRQVAMEELGRTMRTAYDRRRGGGGLANGKNVASSIAGGGGDRAGTALGQLGREAVSERRRGWIKTRTIRRRATRPSPGGKPHHLPLSPHTDSAAEGERGTGERGRRDAEAEWLESLKSPDLSRNQSPIGEWGDGSEIRGQRDNGSGEGPREAHAGFERDSV